MNPFLGAFKPKQFFISNLALSGNQLLTTLLNRSIFLILFCCILTYLVEDKIGDTFGKYAFSDSPLLTAFNVAVWVISTFIIYGMVVSVLGKMFSVTEKPVAIITNTFWGQIYGNILGFFASLIVTVFVLQFTRTPDALNNIYVLLPPIATFFSIKVIYSYLAIKVSMQTTPMETVFVLTLTHILNSIILASIYGLSAILL